jgi:hypothetical protein
MVDGVTLNAASVPGGPVAATDDCGVLGHAQIVKLGVSADGDATPLTATATDGLLVNLGANNDVTVTGSVAVTSATFATAAKQDTQTTALGLLALETGGNLAACANSLAALDNVVAGSELQVDVVGALPAGTNDIGNVTARRGTVRVSVASGGLTTSVTAYSAGDQVGDQFTIAGCARASGGTGRIRSVMLIDVNDIIGAYDVVFSRASITPASNNAAFAISDADALNTVGVVQLAGSFDIGNNRIAQAYGLDIPYDCSGGTSLYANLICRVGHTFFTAVTDLQLIVMVELD